MWLKCIFVVLRIWNVYNFHLWFFESVRNPRNKNKKHVASLELVVCHKPFRVVNCFLGLEMHWVNECMHSHIHTQYTDIRICIYFYVEHFKTKQLVIFISFCFISIENIFFSWNSIEMVRSPFFLFVRDDSGWICVN